MVKCVCGHNKTAHILRHKMTSRFESYARYMDCGWKSCKCQQYKKERGKGGA